MEGRKGLFWELEMPRFEEARRTVVSERERQVVRSRLKVWPQTRAHEICGAQQITHRCLGQLKAPTGH